MAVKRFHLKHKDTGHEVTTTVPMEAVQLRAAGYRDVQGKKADDKPASK